MNAMEILGCIQGVAICILKILAYTTYKEGNLVGH